MLRFILLNYFKPITVLNKKNKKKPPSPLKFLANNRHQRCKNRSHNLSNGALM